MGERNTDSDLHKRKESHRSVFDDMNVLNEILREKIIEKADQDKW